MRKVFLILGVVLAVIVAAGIFIYLQLSKPVVVEVPVAISDIPIGTVLRPNLFRVSRMSNVDPQTLSKWVLLSNWKVVEGKVATSDIRAGFPVARTQIDPNSTSAFETRLSLVLTGTNEYYIVLPTGPNEVGNYLQPADRIDIIISLGSARESLTIGPVITAEMEGGVPVVGSESAVTSTLRLTQTIAPPITKLIMQNIEILRIDRARVAANPQDPTVVGDIKRLYVKVNRDQLEVLSFVLNMGKRAIAVRAANSSAESIPTDGVVWEDFARWFFAQRGNDPASAQPFNTISPSEPRPTPTVMP